MIGTCWIWERDIVIGETDSRSKRGCLWYVFLNPGFLPVQTKTSGFFKTGAKSGAFPKVFILGVFLSPNWCWRKKKLHTLQWKHIGLDVKSNSRWTRKDLTKLSNTSGRQVSILLQFINFEVLCWDTASVKMQTADRDTLMYKQYCQSAPDGLTFCVSMCFSSISCFFFRTSCCSLSASCEKELWKMIRGCLLLLVRQSRWLAFHFCTPFPFISPLTCFFFRASSEVFCAAFSAAGLYTVFVRPIDVENTWKEMKSDNIWHTHDLKGEKFPKKNYVNCLGKLLFQQVLLVWQRNPNGPSLTLWKDSAPKGEKHIMFIHTSCRFGQVYVKKHSFNTIPNTHTYLGGYVGILGGLRVCSEHGSKAIFDRLLQRRCRRLLIDKDDVRILHLAWCISTSLLSRLQFWCLIFQFSCHLKPVDTFESSTFFSDFPQISYNNSQ